MEQKTKSSIMIIVCFLVIFCVASFCAYHVGYALGKYKAHTENNLNSK